MYERLLLALSDADAALGVLARFEQTPWPEGEAEKQRQEAENHWSGKFSAAVDEVRRSAAVAAVIVSKDATQSLERLLTTWEKAREAHTHFEFIDESAAAVDETREFLKKTARADLDL